MKEKMKLTRGNSTIRAIQKKKSTNNNITNNGILSTVFNSIYNSLWASTC